MSFKVGDIVHMVGVVVKDNERGDYPVSVEFGNSEHTFTIEGKYASNEPVLLFHYNPNEVQELKDEIERLNLLLDTEHCTTIEGFEESLKGSEQSILTEAESIVNGSRNSDYGGTEGIERIAQVASTLTNKNITAKDIALIMISLKLVRESFNHKRDNLVDACGYMELLNNLN